MKAPKAIQYCLGKIDEYKRQMELIETLSIPPNGTAFEITHKERFTLRGEKPKTFITVCRLECFNTNSANMVVLATDVDDRWTLRYRYVGMEKTNVRYIQLKYPNILRIKILKKEDLPLYVGMPTRTEELARLIKK